MPDAVADTHALIWYLANDPRLSPLASRYFDECETDGGQIRVPTICAVEIIYLSEKGRIPADMLNNLRRELAAPDTIFRWAPLDENIVNAVLSVPRTAVPDLPDRIIAATAVGLGLPLISRDGKIRASGVVTIW